LGALWLANKSERRNIAACHIKRGETEVVDFLMNHVVFAPSDRHSWSPQAERATGFLSKFHAAARKAAVSAGLVIITIRRASFRREIF
jgi:hypothetical protein